VDATSPVLINKALDGLSMRMMATARNVANANSPNFQPARVNFEAALKAAASRGPGAIARVVPSFAQEASVTGGNEMRLDLELATASETAARYTALVDLLGRQMQISRIVFSGGQ